MKLNKLNNKILIVVGFFPYPCYFGGAYDVFERIIGLKSLGYEIDLVCNYKTLPKEEDIAYIKSIVTNLYFVERKNRIVDMLGSKPLQVLSRNKLKDVVLSNDYCIAILESESVAPILENKTLKAGKIVVRVHNKESKYFYQLGGSTGNILKKAYYYLDGLKFSYYSPKIFSKADRLWFISTDEQQEYVKAHNDNKALHLPPPSNDTFIQQELNNKKVLFIGSLFMPNNISAIQWYLENVHALLVHDFPEYSLVIAGSTGDESEEVLIKMFEKYSNVTLHFNVPDLNALYKDAAVFINPMLHGTGVKLKSINAIVNGLPLVSTKVGSEGIGLTNGKMFLRADTPDEFYKAIAQLFTNNAEDNRGMVASAQDFIKQNDYLTILKTELNDICK